MEFTDSRDPSYMVCVRLDTQLGQWWHVYVGETQTWCSLCKAGFCYMYFQEKLSSQKCGPTKVKKGN
jgi:hypothetical protein